MNIYYISELLEQINYSQGFKVQANIVSQDKMMEQYFTIPSISYHNQESYGLTQD